MKPMSHMPMPMRPRLPLSSPGSMLSTTLMTSKANPIISKELADVTCDSTCTHNHHQQHQHQHQSQQAPSPPPEQPQKTLKELAHHRYHQPYPTKTTSVPAPPILPGSDDSKITTTTKVEVDPILSFSTQSSHQLLPALPDQTDNSALATVLEEDHAPIPLLLDNDAQHGASFSSFDLGDLEGLSHIVDDEDTHQTQNDIIMESNLQESITTLSSSQVDVPMMITEEPLSLPSSSSPPLSAPTPLPSSTTPVPSTTTTITPDPTNMMLHQTCLLFPHNASIVRTALSGYPQAALIPSPVPLNGFTFPLHICLSKNATLPVVQQLVEAAPSLLLQKDAGWTPLALAVLLTSNSSSSNHHMQVFRYLLQVQPKAAGIPCGPQDDLPLHLACRSKASASSATTTTTTTNSNLEVIEALIPANTGALHQVNRQGLTPMLLASTTNGQASRVVSCLKFAANMTRPSLPNSCASTALAPSHGGVGMMMIQRNNTIGATHGTKGRNPSKRRKMSV